MKIFCFQRYSTGEAEFDVPGTTTVAGLQALVLKEMFKPESKSIGADQVHLFLKGDHNKIKSTRTVEEVFRDLDNPIELEAVLVSQTPVTLKLYNEETNESIDKIFDNETDFLEQFKCYTFSSLDDRPRMRSAQFVLRQIRGGKCIGETWLASRGNQRDALKHDQAVSYAFEEAAIRCLENRWPLKRREPTELERVPPCGWRYIKFRDASQQLVTQEWGGIWTTNDNPSDLILLECKLCMTSSVYERIGKKLAELAKHYTIDKVFVAAALWRSNTRDQALAGHYNVILPSGGHLEIISPPANKPKDDNKKEIFWRCWM